MIKQGEIYLASLNPIKGNEQGGLRPVVVISGNAMNSNLGVSIICPISSKIKNYAACIKVEKGNKSGLKQNSEILTFQIRTISHKRLEKKLGEIDKKTLSQVFSGLNDVLKY